MSKLTDRISYLKGMAAGMKLNMEKDSNKLMLEMLGVMGEIAEEMAAMTEAQNDLNEYVESIDDDLANLEETLFGEEEPEDGDEIAEDDEDEELDDELIVYACPTAATRLNSAPMMWTSTRITSVPNARSRSSLSWERTNNHAAHFQMGMRCFVYVCGLASGG